MVYPPSPAHIHTAQTSIYPVVHSPQAPGLREAYTTPPPPLTTLRSSISHYPLRCKMKFPMAREVSPFPLHTTPPLHLPQTNLTVLASHIPSFLYLIHTCTNRPHHSLSAPVHFSYPHTITSTHPQISSICNLTLLSIPLLTIPISKFPLYHPHSIFTTFPQTMIPLHHPLPLTPPTPPRQFAQPSNPPHVPAPARLFGTRLNLPSTSLSNTILHSLPHYTPSSLPSKTRTFPFTHHNSLCPPPIPQTKLQHLSMAAKHQPHTSSDYRPCCVSTIYKIAGPPHSHYHDILRGGTSLRLSPGLPPENISATGNYSLSTTSSEHPQRTPRLQLLASSYPHQAISSPHTPPIKTAMARVLPYKYIYGSTDRHALHTYIIPTSQNTNRVRI